MDLGSSTERPDLGPGREPHRPLYGISVAAELTGVNAPMLRAYESKGLITPHRSAGGTRRYSEYDIARVDRITTLLAAGLNLAGVQEVLRLEEETRNLRARISRLQRRSTARASDVATDTKEDAADGTSPGGR
jgi:MerR family transcriptional regulator/heat shock protein HspR